MKQEDWIAVKALMGIWVLVVLLVVAVKLLGGM